jgi:hypothetical protein
MSKLAKMVSGVGWVIPNSGVSRNRNIIRMIVEYYLHTTTQWPVLNLIIALRIIDILERSAYIADFNITLYPSYLHGRTTPCSFDSLYTFLIADPTINGVHEIACK